jgi:hypothetical protein
MANKTCKLYIRNKVGEDVPAIVES